MFDSNIGNVRKYQCFVCGVMFDEFDEFSSHIKEKHEEGRDYIKCPLERCQAPVRDMRLHFKVKHPSERSPTSGLMKATVWRDFSSSKKKKRKFKEGYHESTKMKKSFYHRSGYEKKIFELLDSWNEVVAYDVEPFQIPYIYAPEGEAPSVHQYTPDIFIVFTNGVKKLWEIKPANQTTLQKNKDKWNAANEACLARGWEFEVITEKGIKLLTKTVKNQYLQEDKDSSSDF